MEHEGQTISSVVVDGETCTVNYENGAKEMIMCCCEAYIKMYEKWIKTNPPFISDKFKSQMRNITLVAINDNHKCFKELCCFFEQGHEEEIKNFFTYMRNRETTLVAKKAIWTVAQ